MNKVYFILAMALTLFMMLIMGILTFWVAIGWLQAHPYVALICGVVASYVGFVFSPANTDKE